MWKHINYIWKWSSNTPFTPELRLPKKGAPRDRLISPQEIKLICEALFYDIGSQPSDTRDYVAIAFLWALETAMRQGEIFNLTWDNVYVEDRYCHLPITKNGSARNVSLSAKAIELLGLLKVDSDSHAVFPINQGSAGQIFRRAVQLAGIDNLRFHDSRHEAITRLASKLNVLELARMVGHNDIRSLQIYYNAHASEIATKL